MGDIFKLGSIRGKMILTFVVITVIFGAANIYSQFNSKKILSRTSQILEEYNYLNVLSKDITELEIEVEKYLSSKASSALINYYNIYSRVSEKSKLISREKSFDQDKVMLKDISYMIDEFLKSADSAINAKRRRSSSEYNDYFEKTYKISQYIRFYIDNLLKNKLNRGSEEYESTKIRMEKVNLINVILIFSITVSSIIIAVLFTYRITNPIIIMSNAAEQISKGNYDIENIEVKAHDELFTLAEGFKKMAGSVKEHIEGIKNQAETEHRLKEQEMQNLKMKNLLKEAELKSLQSQINPHFLFNTLNAASQLSTIEGADRSAEFILKAAQLFRYSLRKLDEPVTIEDEVENVRAYMFILKTRFGDRISYNVYIDEKIKNHKIPCTIIQPIVENAYIHGLEDIEEKGKINLEIKDRGEWINISVRDNGAGMEKDEIVKILTSVKESSKDCHVTGIGTRNVVERLKLFYNIEGSDNVIDIKSRKGVGTEVTLRIPKVELKDMGDAK